MNVKPNEKKREEGPDTDQGEMTPTTIQQTDQIILGILSRYLIQGRN